MQQYLSKRAINNTVKLVKLYLPSLARGRRTIRDSSQLNCGGGRARAGACSTPGAIVSKNMAHYIKLLGSRNSGK